MHRHFAGAEDVDFVDGMRLDNAHRHSPSACHYKAAKRTPVNGRDLLGVIDPEDRAVAIKHDRGGHDRPGQASPTHFVGTGDDPKAALAKATLDLRHLGQARELGEERLEGKEAKGPPGAAGP